MTNQRYTSQAIKQRSSRFWMLSIGLSCISLVSFLAALGMGAYSIPYSSVLQVLAGLQGSDTPDTWQTIIIEIRLSRLALSWVIGAGLAVAGVIFQGILRNPLADPYTLGVSSGGAFGASLAITLGIGSGSLGLFTLPICALGGSLCALFLVLALGRIGGALRRETLVLAGIVVATFLSACISLFKALNEESVAAIVFWIMGSFQGRGWEHMVIILPLFTIGIAVTAYYSRELDLLSLGETQATLTGVDSNKVRFALLVGASCLSAGAVSVCGIVGFVGLMVPHLVRMMQGGEHRPLLLNSALMGGLLLLWADTLSRVILADGAELPVGVVTAMLGGPFFCLLLRKTKGGSI